MKMSRIVLLFLSKVVFICNGLRVLGPSGPLTVQPGGSVMLPCYVETPIPMEELEVEWRRTDSETIVHLFQDGESRPESQDQYYHERARFFTEKVALGNFSLLLTDVTAKDTGIYKCVVYRNHELNETLIELKMKEYLTVSGGHVVSAYVGEDTTLNCSVHSDIPPEQIEQVSWKKMDQDVIVLLLEMGQVKNESTNERYRDRVELFNPEEIHKGNFSLRLKNLQLEDKGMYMCEAFHGDLSSNTTVEVLKLGVSNMHIGVLFFCILAFVPLLLGRTAYTSLQHNENNQSVLAIQCIFVCCPAIAMVFAFIIWGVTEGFFTETITCSALNLLRIPSLFWVVSHFRTFSGNIRRCFQKSAGFQGRVLGAVIYSVLFVPNWHKYEASRRTINKWFPWTVILIYLGDVSLSLFMMFTRYKGSNFQNMKLYGLYFIKLIGIFVIFYWYGSKGLAPWVLIILFSSFLLLLLLWLLFQQRVQFLLWISVALTLDFTATAISIYLHYDTLGNDREQVPMICSTTYLHVFSTIELFEYIVFSEESNSNSIWTGQLSDRLHMVVYMLGGVGLICVNSLSLIVELILKNQNGERTVTDLRVILLPAECVFAMCCLALQLPEFWKKKRERLKNNITYCRKLCRCTQTSRDPGVENHELENLGVS